MRPPISSTLPRISQRSSPSPKEQVVPGFSRRPGRTSASQSVAVFRRSSSTSTGTPVSSFTPSRRAGITRVSLMTRASPGFSSSMMS